LLTSFGKNASSNSQNPRGDRGEKPTREIGSTKTHSAAIIGTHQNEGSLGHSVAHAPARLDQS
jgi:hypothetical protein